MSDKECDIVLQNKEEPYLECASLSVCSALQAADSASGQVGRGWGRLPAVSQMGEMLPCRETGPNTAPLSVMERLIYAAGAWPEGSAISMTLAVL